MENLLKNLEELREQVSKTWRLLDIDRKKERANEAKIEMSKANFWDNHESAVKISKEAEMLNDEVDKWENLLGLIRELEELVAVGQNEKDNSIDDIAHKQYKELKAKYEELEFYVLFSGKYDASDAILSIHAGTGGVDAQDWAQMLERMYLRFAEKKDFKVEILDRLSGQEAGIKSVIIKISGKWAYGYLRSETGVHRLVRISPFDADSARHTSFASVELVPDLPETVEIEISDKDLHIDVFKSSGPGGQGVNTTDSAVRIKHLPSALVVTCQNERSQHQNKESAMKILKAKLFKTKEDEREKKEKELKGETKIAQWGNQIRSYVFQPYQMVKDHRTKFEKIEIDKVMDGELEGFMEAYLRFKI
ncbi:peptide chain release factor 2 [Candidatus Parcubacteria bacterium]|nr:peptide chain release factor 2 [Candidatus Parcubacteria bacterium]